MVYFIMSVAAHEIAGIAQVGQVIDPDLAIQLGENVARLAAIEQANKPADPIFGLSFAREPSESGLTTLIPDSHFPEVLLISLGETDRDTVYAAYDLLGDLVEIMNPDDWYYYSGDVTLGTAGAGKWHIDGERDTRILVNLSPFSIGLKVGRKWKSSDYPTDITEGVTPPEPEEFTELRYGPGEGIVLNNPADFAVQIPHAGSCEDNRLLMRLFAHS